MILTGKCKEDFEKWYENPLRTYVALQHKKEWFYTLTYSMQYGVYVDFFDYIGLELCVERNVDSDLNYTEYYDYVVINTNTLDNYGGGGYVKTRTEAREAVLLIANSIINNKVQNGTFNTKEK